jgi:hypothetical protein
MAQDFILDAQNFIFDPETRKNVAIIRNGEVFRNEKEGARIAYFVGSSLYDLNGNFLGRLDGCARSFPIGFRKLLEANSNRGFAQKCSRRPMGSTQIRPSRERPQNCALDVKLPGGIGLGSAARKSAKSQNINFRRAILFAEKP